MACERCVCFEFAFFKFSSSFAVELSVNANHWCGGCRKEGATCNGPPGVRAQYTDKYYAAYVLDPDGHNIEAIFFG